MCVVHLYRYSMENAQRNNEIDLWRESFNENMRCADFIDGKETGVSTTGYDGYHVDKKYIHKVIDEFGYQRTAWVLANTIIHKSQDGRWSEEAKKWAKEIYEDKTIDEYDKRLVLNTHPGLVDILAKQVKKIYMNFNLYNHTNCDLDDGDYRNKVIILNPSSLKEKYWKPEYQLCYATSGFGCDPNASGRAIYLTFLYDGEQTRFNRTDVIGVMKETDIPDWAWEKLNEIRPSQEDIGMKLDM